jgi:hypothetical protein
MTPWVIAAVLYCTTLAAVLWYLTRPKQKPPKASDELELSIQALRGRVLDLEDRFEHYVKRESVRAGRAAERAPQAAQGTKAAELARLRGVAVTKGLLRGII